MYCPPLPKSQIHVSTWEFRRNLLRDKIGLVGADVVCFQEVSPRSFEKDFAFMWEDLGYDGVELFKKGRFRPATFWKKDRCDLIVPPVHKDRTLLTTFQLKSHTSNTGEQVEVGVVAGNGSGGDTKKQRQKNNRHETNKNNWHVLNCHLQAGKQGGRRLRQINEGVGAAHKLAKKLKEDDPGSPLLIVCGDFNGGAECGAVRYVEDGSIGPEFREDGEPVTSKVKASPLSKPLFDVVTTNGLGRGPPPPTLVVPELISLMVEEGTMDTPVFSKDILRRLERIYKRFATQSKDEHNQKSQPKQMSKEDVERWLVVINGKVGRGTEFRNAAKEMGWKQPSLPVEKGGTPNSLSAASESPTVILPDDSALSFDGFVNIYTDELRQGKFWSIAYDLAVLQEPLPDAGVYTARFDRMYCSSRLQPIAVLDTLSDNIPCPNEREPSDHLPVAATLQLR